jgi:hypothetical protein
VNSTTGFTAGDGGTILKTNDAGVTWVSSPSGTTNDLESLSFADATVGYVCGNSGIILKTTNGGLVHINEFPEQVRLLDLFPNPATSEFIVTIPTELLNQKQLTLRLYNSRGELIHNEPVIPAKGKITINIEAYAKGLYQVSLGNGKKWYAGKVVVE